MRLGLSITLAAPPVAQSGGSPPPPPPPFTPSLDFSDARNSQYSFLLFIW